MKIGNRNLKLPLIQGGMGVGISLGRLAGNVALNGGMGVISIADIGFREKDFWKNSLKANIRALKKEIKKAREIAKGKGLIAINAMVPMKEYFQLVKCACEQGIDAIISGAGLPLELPSIAKEHDVLLSPIVSSSRAAKTIFKIWDRRFGKIPDFLYIEGPLAGGHLGFKYDDLINNNCQSLEEIFTSTKKEIRTYEEKYNKNVSIFVAGGISNRDDVLRFMKLGVDGVAVGTKFIATKECDAGEEFKKAIINSRKEDVDIFMSPLGLPGRAIINNLIKETNIKRKAPKRCVDCLVPCDVKSTKFCITQALINSCTNEFNNGLVFAGSNAYKINEIKTVKEVIDELFGLEER